MAMRRRLNLIDRNHAFRGGFSFIEVLFAVMILGVGFIMIAAIFPVAIQQTTTSVEETTSARLVSSATGTMKEYYNRPAAWPATTAVVGNPGDVWWFRHPTGGVPLRNVWYNFAGNLISTDNARYAYIPLYQRGLNTAGANPSSTMYIVTVVARNAAVFSPINDLVRYPTGAVDTAAVLPEQATLEPRPVYVTLLHRTHNTEDDGTTTRVPDPDGRDLISVQDITSGPLAVPFAMDAAVEGAFVIISNHPAMPAMNGRIFRLGALRANLASPARTQFELVAGYEMSGLTENVFTTQTVTGLLIGRSLRDPTLAPTGLTGTNPYTGPSMAVDVKLISLP